MEVSHTSMIHAAAPHFLWSFAVRYAVHQLNLWPSVNEPETSPALRWTGKVGDASVFWVCGAFSSVRDAKASKLSSRTLHCVFLGFPTDAPPWQFYHLRSCRVFSSQNITFDESACYYRLHPHASHPIPLAPLFLVPIPPPPVDTLPPQDLAPSDVSQEDPPSLVEPLEVSFDSFGPAEGGDPAADDTAATRRSPCLETPPGFPPQPSSPPLRPVAVDSGDETAGAETGGAETGGEGSGGAATGGADFGGPASPSGGGAVGDPIGGPGAGQPPLLDLLETLLPQAIRAWIVRRGSPGGGGYGPAGAGVACPGGTAGAGGTGGTAFAGGAAGAGGTRGATGAGGAGTTCPRGPTGARGAGPTSPGGTAGVGDAGGAAGARGTGAGGTGGARTGGTGGTATGTGSGCYWYSRCSTGGTGTAGAAGPGGARTGRAGAARAGGAVHAGGATGAAGSGGTGGSAGAGGAGAAKAGGTAGAGGAGGATGATGSGGAGGTTGARGPGAAGDSGAAGAGGARGATRAAGVEGARVAGTALRRPFFYPQPQSSLPPPYSVLHQVLSLPSSTGLPLPLLCPPTDQSQPQLLPGSSLPAPAPHTEVTESLTERREPETRASTPVRALRVARPRPPAVPGTHGMALRPSSVPQRVVLREPPASSLPHVLDPESDLAPAASPTVTRLLTIVVNDPDLESTAAFSLVTELVDFAARSRLDYVAILVPESESVCPPSLGGKLALGSDVREHRQFELECLAGALPRFASMLLCPEGDPDALDIPTLRSYAEVITGEYSSQWQTAMDAEMASWNTSGMGLVLGGQGSVVLTGHADASWADDQATQRSSQGYTFSLGFDPVSWRSTRSSSVLSSSCEAEIYAGAMVAQELRWLTYLLSDLGEPPRSPPVQYVDNKAMIALCHEQRLEHRTKHIALRYFLAHELQQRRQLRLSYVASWANTADVFTKALRFGDHQRFCTALGLLPTLPHLLVA
ncbi:unnamed protein product [Closterium sp. NIES-53]